MPESISYHKELIKSLQDPSEAAIYLEVVLEEGDPKMIRKAFYNIIEVKGGLHRLSNSFQEQFDRFEKKIEETGEIEFSLLRELLESLGLKVGLTAIASLE